MESLDKIGNVWQFLTTIGITLVAILAKHWVNNSERTEAEKTKKRKKDRDSQFEGFKNEIKNELEKTQSQVTGLGNSFDEHKRDHKEKEEKTEEQLNDIARRVHNIEKNLIERAEFLDLQKSVHNVDKSIVEIAAILKERTRPIDVA